MRKEETVDYYTLSITDDEFARLQDFIVEETGILLNPAKRELVQNRLRPLLRERNLTSYGAYYEWLTHHPHPDELHQLIESITTNKTEFFRNEFHFDFFRRRLLPELLEQLDLGKTFYVRLWSAGCSTGEEPYTMAIACLEGVPASYHNHFRIVASDIDRIVLEQARDGVYDRSRLQKLPDELIEKYFRPAGNNMRAAPTIRAMVEFQEVNLVDDATWPDDSFQAVFCRNVLIYMRQDMKRAIMDRFHKVVQSNGYLFLGHSETLHGLDVPFEYVEPSIYRKVEE